METTNDTSAFKTSQTSLKSTQSLEAHSASSKRSTIQFKQASNDDETIIDLGPDKVPHKFIANWKQACDRTKDKTRDLLKRWRTLPEIETAKTKLAMEESSSCQNTSNGCQSDVDKPSSGWSVHIWTTWVDRFSIESSGDEVANSSKSSNYSLTQIQNDKLSHFFVHLLDHDQDNLISEQDFEALSENGDHKLDFEAYRLCFANYLFGRYPNGSGHHILGAPAHEKSSAMFPVDYSALNTEPEDLEKYVPDTKSNRKSVVV